MGWKSTVERLIRHRSPFLKTPEREGPPETSGWQDMPLRPELFATFSEPWDTVCPTPWNMLGLMIGNQLSTKEEHHEDGNGQQCQTATIQ
jgi:hypothetical protein